ncbi:hypothetical protein QQX98_001864 [Neonectria punicea]|uniref:Serine-threonine/tyrosine-protein kinase catalytic domain-containing protein n=1 Tax=Neonectria punicea TaxID=979145 RepID=A0ABR1HLP0_9HYPO
MRHDIYSVGVCMLEIGLWETFVTYSAPREPAQHGPGLGIKDDNKNGSELFQKPESKKAHFLELARGDLLEKAVGKKYCKIVETCLTCLDKGNVDFGDDKEFRDGDGVLVRSKYIEKVYTRLSEIVI